MTTTIRARPAGQVLLSGVRNHGQMAAGHQDKAPTRMTADDIVARLEAAGATLLALPSSGYTTHMRQMRFDIVHTALEAYGWVAPALRVPVPAAAAISAMDEAFLWLAMIPEEKFLLRRVLGARALVHPLTGRHLFAWRRLAATLGVDHKSVQRWHGQGVQIIRQALAR